MERVTLRLPESEVKGLEILAEAGCHPNRSEGIREAVSEYINGVADNPRLSTPSLTCTWKSGYRLID